jgi:hypothetical protein
MFSVAQLEGPRVATYWLAPGEPCAPAKEEADVYVI